MTVNQATLDLIKEFEGLELTAYKDAVGIWTIGYGTTAAAGVGVDPKPGMRITKADAEHYLSLALDKFAAKIDPLFKRPINENERGAFLSLAYNIGPGAFASSSALRYFNAGDKAEAARRITLWNKGTVNGKLTVLRGLVRRREAERQLFLTAPTSAPVVAPVAPAAPDGTNARIAALAQEIRYLTGHYD